MSKKKENKHKQGKKGKFVAKEIQLLIMMIIGLGLFLFLMWYFQPVKADERHKLIELDVEKKIEAVIGANVANRIEVKGEDLLEVVGDESKYQLKWNKNHRSIYLVPKAEVGEVIELSLMLVSGQVQDLRLTIGDVLARTIVLVSKNDQAEFYETLEKAEIRALLKAMVKDENPNNKYWLSEEKIKLITSKEKYISQIREYKYGELIGRVIEIENKGKSELIIREGEIKEIIPEVKLVSFSKRILGAREKAKLFVISKKE